MVKYKIILRQNENGKRRLSSFSIIIHLQTDNAPPPEAERPEV
jgi:hypothetical protein